MKRMSGVRTTKRPRLPIVLGGIVLILVAVGLLLWQSDGWTSIDYYRLDDSGQLIVGAGTGNPLWSRVSTVTETATSVTVGIRIGRPWTAGTGSQVTEFVIPLQQPLGTRSVIDASNDVPVPLLK